MAHRQGCTAIVISCIDYRFQEFIDEWLQSNHLEHQFDRVALAGGVFDFYTILKQIEIANNLHHIQKVVLINHEDCGAYGADSTYERHTHDLVEAERKIEALFPKLDVEIYYLHLDGTFEHLSKTKNS
jgi:carbonic anhydrase